MRPHGTPFPTTAPAPSASPLASGAPSPAAESRLPGTHDGGRALPAAFWGGAALSLAGAAATIGAEAFGRPNPHEGRWFYTPPLIVVLALLATAAGRTGLLGGLLFIVSDSVLAAGQFGVRIPEPLRTAAVIGTYAPAQVLLTAGWWRLTGGGVRG